jgi:hypothetical protein
MSYTNADTDIVGGAIQAAWRTVEGQVSPETRLKLYEWLMNFISGEKPYLWASPENIPRIVQMVYSDELVRDFVHSLQFHFMLRWGEASTKFTGLVDVLSWSIGSHGLDTEHSGRNRKEDHGAIPEDIRMRLSSREDVKELLLDNPWMVCLLLLRSFVSLVDPTKLKSPYGDSPDVKTIEAP